MDDRWESEITEYGAINITGFRIVDTDRRYVREFLDGWKRLDPSTSIGAGKESITVCNKIERVEEKQHSARRVYSNMLHFFHIAFRVCRCVSFLFIIFISGYSTLNRTISRRQFNRKHYGLFEGCAICIAYI